MSSTLGALILALLQGLTVSAPFASATATTPSSIIAVIVPKAANAPMVDALTRLRGEAASVGFEIRLVESHDEVAPLGQLELVAREISPAAVVTLVATPDAGRPPGSPIGTIDVWFLDRGTGKISVGHLSVDEEAGDRTDLVLAVRVVDFIRARMFDSLVRARAATKNQRTPEHLTVGRRYVAAGFAGTGSFSGFAPAFMPCLELGYGVLPWLRLVVGAGGLGDQIRQDEAAGSATMDEVLGTASLAFLARGWWRFVPYAQTGVSLLYVSVHGDGNSGYQGHDAVGWSPGWFGAAGLDVVVSSHVLLQVSGGAMLLLREPKVYIAGTEVARTGRPAWMGSALFGVTF